MYVRGPPGPMQPFHELDGGGRAAGRRGGGPGGGGVLDQLGG